MDSKEQAMFNAAYAAYYDAAPMRAERFVGSLREEKVLCYCTLGKPPVLTNFPSPFGAGGFYHIAVL